MHHMQGLQHCDSNTKPLAKKARQQDNPVHVGNVMQPEPLCAENGSGFVH